MTRSRTTFVLIGALSAAFAAGTAHIVVPGDTLWDITGAYLGDPFKWPTVWKYNPQIADAHWIYPGDTVHLENVVDSSKRAASPFEAGGMPAHPSSSDPLAEFPLNPDFVPKIAADTERIVKLATSPAQGILNADAMRVAPVHYLPSEVPAGAQSRLDWAYETSQHMLRPGTVVGTGLGTDKGIQVGSLLEIVEFDERVLAFSDPKLEGRYEQMRGVCVVVEATSDSSRCMLQRVYGDASIRAVARPYNPPPERVVTGFKPVEGVEAARVVGNTRNSQVQMPGNYVIIDRGTQAGINEGDVFEFMAAGERRGIAAMRGYGIVIRATPSAATIFLEGVRQKAISIGDRAWMVRKAVGPG